ncbi:MAG TPA: HAD hydrolase-like protein [Sediminibacterium sp.]
MNQQLSICQKKVVFWDFDGVVKESVEIKTIAFIKLFEPFGADVTNKVREHHLLNGGMSRFKKIPLYLSWAGQPADKNTTQTFCDQFAKLVIDEVINCEWVPGAQVFLNENRFNQLFIVTSATPQVEMEMIITALDLQSVFSRVYGAPVAKKDAIAKALAELNIDREHAVMIGDATADYNAAVENGIAFVLRRHKSNKASFLSYDGLAIENITELV